MTKYTKEKAQTYRHGVTYARKSKYGNVITEYNGRKYHSKKEAIYAKTLDMQKMAMSIHDRVISWTPQVSFTIQVNGHHICKYILDFEVIYADGHTEYIDVKGKVTDVYRIKKALMFAVHGIEIKEV